MTNKVLKQDDEVLSDTIEMINMFQKMPDSQRKLVLMFMRINATPEKARLYLISDHQ